MFIPANCTLTIHGPQSVTLFDAVPEAPQLVPQRTPALAPVLAPPATPQATPVAQPTMTIPAYQPTYTSWGGYAPVPQATPPAIWEGYSPVAPDQHKGQGADPAVLQMAAYLEAREADEARRELLARAEKEVKKQREESKLDKDEYEVPKPEGAPPGKQSK